MLLLFSFLFLVWLELSANLIGEIAASADSRGGSIHGFSVMIYNSFGIDDIQPYGLMIYKAFRFDDIHAFAVMIYNSFGIDDIHAYGAIGSERA